MDIVTLPSSESLTEQLRKKYNAGFELHTWSVAPQGSGLGTSSILAGVILAALLRATGRKATLDSLVHAVLLIEQMLTTGGGWQDNAGGLVPGFKMTRSKASLPLKVEVEPLQLSQETVDKFSERLICLYSGKPRLAKNLLQVKPSLIFFFELLNMKFIVKFIQARTNDKRVRRFGDILAPLSRETKLNMRFQE